ncbi:hypothetical protein SMICM304S_11136 [Streptomyces microflavus]
MDSPVLPMMAYRPNCLFTDGAKHPRLRKAVTESLARLNSSRPSRDVERIADYLIDQFIERGTADLLNEYAKLLPLLLFNQLFGCPGDIGDRLTRSMFGHLRRRGRAARQRGADGVPDGAGRAQAPPAR